jgi:hypothetical protein
MAAPLGSIGGYEEIIETGPNPYFQAPIVAEDIPMGGTVAGEFRRVTKPLTFVPLNAQYW